MKKLIIVSCLVPFLAQAASSQKIIQALDRYFIPEIRDIICQYLGIPEYKNLNRVTTCSEIKKIIGDYVNVHDQFVRTIDLAAPVNTMALSDTVISVAQDKHLFMYRADQIFGHFELPYSIQSLEFTVTEKLLIAHAKKDNGQLLTKLFLITKSGVIAAGEKLKPAVDPEETRAQKDLLDAGICALSANNMYAVFKTGKIYNLLQKKIITDIKETAFKAATFAPDCEFLAALTWDDCLTIWDTKTGQVLVKHDAPAMVTDHDLIAFSPSGKYIACYSARNRQIAIWKNQAADLK